MSSETPTFEDFFNGIRQGDGYWNELAIHQFAEDVFAWMQQKGWSKADLAREMGVSQAYITKIMKGNANFTLASMTRIARVLGARLQVQLVPIDAPYPVRHDENDENGEKEQAEPEEAPLGKSGRRARNRI